MTKQFNFNSSVEEIIITARNQLTKMIPVSEREKEALKKLQILWTKVPSLGNKAKTYPTCGSFRIQLVHSIILKGQPIIFLL